MRQLLSDDTWSQHQRWLQDRTPWQDRAYDYIAKDCPAAKLASRLDLRLHQAAFLHALPSWLEPMRHEVAEQTSPEVRGEFDVNSAHIDFGWHDIVDTGRKPQGRFFGRSICAVTIFGYGLIRDRTEFEKSVVDLPTFSKLQRDVESIVSPCGVAVSISY